MLPLPRRPGRRVDVDGLLLAREVPRVDSATARCLAPDHLANHALGCATAHALRRRVCAPRSARQDRQTGESISACSAVDEREEGHRRQAPHAQCVGIDRLAKHSRSIDLQEASLAPERSGGWGVQGRPSRSVKFHPLIVTLFPSGYPAPKLVKKRNMEESIRLLGSGWGRVGMRQLRPSNTTERRP